MFQRLCDILQVQYDTLADAEEKEGHRLDNHLEELIVQVEELEQKIIKQREIVREKAEALATQHETNCGIIDARLNYIVDVYKNTHKKLVDCQKLITTWKRKLLEYSHLNVKQLAQEAIEKIHQQKE